jgi:hypothetical protein
MGKNQTVMVAVAFCVGLGLGSAILLVASCASPAPANSAPKYSYLHFRAGGCRENGKMGQGVIDLRNGHLYCVPVDGSEPIPEGTLNLDSIPVE